MTTRRLRSFICFSLLCLLFPTRGWSGDSVVVFNELMYHPRDDDAVEWVELHNQMAVDVDVSGWEFEGIGYRFPTNTVIAGGGYLVIASNPAELARRSGLATVHGPFSGRLANEGEALVLRNHNRRIMDVIEYGTNEPWPVGPDGSGFTLAKLRPSAASEPAENWSSSVIARGTPGAANFSNPPAPPAIVLNEVAAATNQPFWIEIANLGSNTVDITNYELEFSRSPALRIQISGPRPLGPGELFHLELGSYLPRPNEKLFLFSADRMQLLDAIEIQDRGSGRSSAHGNRWLHPSMETPGGTNQFASPPKLVINEIMYGGPRNLTNEPAWIELFNFGESAIDLTGWKVSGLGYSFPAGAAIAPGEFLVVSDNAALLSERHPGIRIFGNFSGRLSRSTDHLVLEDAFGSPVDEVVYYDSHPWPEFADGQGASLELRDPRADNSRPEGWAASRSFGEWQSYTYTAVAASDRGPTRWNEFIFGLLDAGEVLLDDFSVMENPASNGREILQNGGFERGGTTWRFLGTHRKATVIPDPNNPTNQVLHLIADGPTEHMHNHVETTLLGNQPIRNGMAYRISFRAKWLGGSDQLNTRLYFNRVARTTALQRPSFFGTPGRSNSVLEANIGPTFAEMRHAPAVPRATESVRVTVRVSDPDEVQSCVLRWGANGANWASVEMQLQGDVYTGSIPARPTGTVVQFYVEAQDGAGAKSYYPAAGPASRALYKVNDNQTLSTRLHNFRILMLPADATTLHAPTNVMSNGRSPATVIYNEAEAFYDCGLHLQGSERGRMDPSRVGFTVSFPADRLFRGVHDTISFDRSGGWSGRGGRQDEIVMRHIINQAGDSPDMYNDLVRVLAPQTTHTGTAMLLMSKYDNEFIDGSVYPEDGALFKLELIYYPTTSVGNDPQQPKIPQPDEVIGIDIGNLGSSAENYRWFFIAENKAANLDYSGLIRMAQAFSFTGTLLQQRTSELMDMDQWTRVFALKSLSGDVDTYGFGLQHNHLFYIPPEGKALTFPWDMDFAWTRSASESISVGSRIGQIIHTIPAHHRLYLGHLDDILATSYNTNYMARWTAHYGSLAGQNYAGILSYIDQRARAVRAQLGVPAAFQITSFSGQTFWTNSTSIVLRGTAPYTLKKLQVNSGEPGAGFTWINPETWEVRVPLQPGSNLVSILGHDFRGQPAASLNVTIVSGNDATDTDQDGMPDQWEIQHQLDPRVADAAEDPDQDGFPNIAEYLAGTSPRDPKSRLALAIQRTELHRLQLTFSAQAGRAYQLQYRPLATPDWRDLAAFAAAETNRVVSRSQTIGPMAPSLFYRVVLDTNKAPGSLQAP